MCEVNDAHENDDSISENSDVDKTDWCENIGNDGEECEIASRAFKRSHEDDVISMKRKRTSCVESTLSRSDEIRPIENAINEKSVQEKDECSFFTDLLATKLRSLNENSRDMLMREIDHLYFCAKYISPLTNTDYPMRNINQ